MKIGLLINSRLGLPALQTLLENRINICVLLAETDNPEVENIKALCESYNHTYSLIKPSKGKKGVQEWVKKEQPELVLVMTFPIIIPKELLQSADISWYNFHFALLPSYGGAEPIFWQIKNREPFGGITVHKLTEKVDQGPIAIQQKIAIEEDDTHGTHMSKLAQACVPVMINLINLWQQTNNNIPLQKQEDGSTRLLPKAGLQDITIKWDKMTAKEIKALVQACNPWNKGAITFLNGSPLWICEVEVITIEEPGFSEKPGFIFYYNNNLIVRCLDKNFVLLKIIHTPEGYMNSSKFNSIFNAETSIFTS